MSTPVAVQAISAPLPIPRPAPSSAQSRKAIYAASIGNVMEWYDFNIFAFMAVPLAKNFFPSSDATAGLLSTFAVLGVGLVVRPLGGLVIGRMGDIRGRKPALIFTVLLMAIGTGLIGVLPNYASIGILAPALLVAARMMQGFSTGGEWGSATTFMAEWSQDRRRGYFTSIQQLSNAVGLLLGSGIAAVITTMLSADAIESWAWRIPFLIGALFGPIGLWLRRSIDETPPFRDNEDAGAKADANVPDGKAWKAAATAVGFAAGWTVCFYAFLNFMPAFTRVQLKLSPAESLWANTLGVIAFTIFVPIMGALSDRIGRKPLLLLSSAAFFVLPLPVFMLLLQARSFVLVVAAQLLFGFALSLYSGAGPAAIAELFPTRGRSMWLSLSFSLAVAVFGGFTPFISQWLIAAVGSPLAPTFYIMVVVAMSFTVVLQMQETAHGPLR
jgi:MHS family proline/betaine transporter-like MFS transporter